jgi:glycosyltransferase involved in cell wall biosynthesis
MKPSSDHTFVVIIPTRERCDTLRAALKTCLTQDYPHLQVIVSDNASQDDTHDFIATINDPRVQYINTGRRISMSANWEFALSHVKTGFVTFLGDDDGLMPGALHYLNMILQQHPHIPAIAWKKADYTWANYADYIHANLLDVPLGQQVEVMVSRQTLAEVLNSKRVYLQLPCLYNSFVDMSVITRLRAQSGGSFFRSSIPDIYSGVAISRFIDRHLYLHRPCTVAGGSGHSTGASTFNPGKNAHLHQTFIAENDMEFHPSLVMAPSVNMFVAESFFQTQQHLGKDPTLKLEIPKLMHNLMREAMEEPATKYALVAEAVQTIGAHHGRALEAADIIRQYPHTPRSFARTIGYNRVFNSIRVRADRFGVRDVYEASLLAHHLWTLQQEAYLSPRGIATTTLTLVRRNIQRRLRLMRWLYLPTSFAKLRLLATRLASRSST